jgi:cytochrome P450
MRERLDSRKGPLSELPRPPKASGLPLVGHAYGMAKDPFGHLYRKYREMGPIYRIELVNRRFTVLAGPEANRFFARKSGELFLSEGFWDRFAREVGASEFLINADGETHQRLRRAMKRGFSRDAIVDRLPEVVSLTREIVRQIDDRRPVWVVRLMQRLITQQLGALLCNVRSDDYFDDLRIFINTILNVTVIRRWPRLMLYRPSYRRAHRRVYGFARDVIAVHQSTRRVRPDIIDDLVAAYQSGEIYQTEAELLIAVIGPFLAGMDTVANTLAFMLHALLEHPAALERVRRESAMLLDGAPTMAKLKRCLALQGALRETLRLYPAGPVILRTARKSFDFHGYRVDEGELVMIAITVPHRMSEFHDNPADFDIDRATGDHGEYRASGAFAPFGLGTHACLGSNLGEILMMITMATLVHDHRIRMHPAHYRLTVSVNPVPTPSHFRIRVLPASECGLKAGRYPSPGIGSETLAWGPTLGAPRGTPPSDRSAP